MATMTVDQGMAIFESLVQRNKQSAGYDKRVEDTEFWESIIVYNHPKFKDRVTQYRSREDDAQKDQRVRLTKNPVPELVYQSTGHIERIHSPDGRNNFFKYAKENEETKGFLKQRVNKFFGNEDALTYIINTTKDRLCVGPNDYLVVLFDGQRGPQGEFREKPYPVPFVVPCANVYEVGKWTDGTDSYLCERRIIEAPPDIANMTNIDPSLKVIIDSFKKKETSYKVYTFYAAGFTLEATQINSANPLPKPTGTSLGVTVMPEKVIKMADEDETYQFSSYLSESKETPFAALGMTPNRNNKGFYSFLEPTRPALEDALNNASEYAIAKALHVHIKPVQYANKCEYQEQGKGRCVGGRLLNDDCPSCKGTGMHVFAGPQDVLLMPIEPGEGTIPAIRDMMHYFVPPFEIVGHMKSEVSEAIHRVTQILWGADLRQVQQPSAATATEIISRYDMVYKRLNAIEKHIGMLWCKLVRLTAQYAQIDEGLEVVYEAREDFQMETLKELFEALALAKESGAPLSSIYYLEDRIMKKMRSSEIDMAWHRVMRAWKPFSEKAPEELTMTLEMVTDDSYLKTLSIFYSDIMNDIRREVPNFVLMDFAQQDTIIKQYTDEYKAMLRQPMAQLSGEMFGERLQLAE